MEGSKRREGGVIPSRCDVLVRTFQSENLRGSPQHLHFFASLDEMKEGYSQYLVRDETDHSFVCLYDDKKAHVLWKNKAGQIQFCGSGAYALGWAAAEIFKKDELYISLGEKEIYSYCKSKSSYLEIPCMEVEEVKTGNTFVSKESGIYFLQLKESSMLEDNKFIEQQLNVFKEEFSNDIHGFCVFCWQNSQGFVRYFSPWHGRDEDYVTGSIHQCLTPLVYRLFAVNEQNWVQRSPSGGQLQTVYNHDKVILFGQCSLIGDL